MPSRVRELRSFQGLIDAVAAAGIQPPREYMQLRGRLGQLQSLVLSDDRPMLDRLTAAVITGGSAEKSPLSELLVLARAEQGRVNLEPVLVHVFAATLTEMQRVYAPHAQANYRAIAAKFNTTAKAFTSCAGVIDPGSAPDEVLAGDARSITIWRDALTRAAELDKLLEPLAAAAELWRGPNEPVGLGVSRDPFTITLVADVEHLNKRHVWAAWRDEPEPAAGPMTTDLLQPQPTHQPTRGGRWTRLHRCGAVLGAHPNPLGMNLLGAPQPMGIKLVTPPAAGLNVGKPRWERFDPEVEAAKPKGALQKFAWLKRRHQTDDQAVDILDSVLDAEETPDEQN